MDPSRHGPLAALLLLVGAAAAALSWSGELADLGGDSTTYVLSARHYAPYLPADPVARTVAADSQFPPLYPLLLAATGGALDLRLAHAVTVACFLLALAAYHANLLALGLSRSLALACIAIFALMPETLARILQLKSECLFLALSLAGFSRLTPTARARDCWIATTLFALALLTRSAGLALLPALLVAVVRARPRGWPWMPAVMLAPALAWATLRTEQAYGSLAIDVLLASPSALVDLVVLNATAVGWGLAGNLLQTHALAVALVPLAAIAAAVLVRRLVRGQPDAWYLAAYLAMLLLWPYPEEAQRFGWVVMPWLLGYAVAGADRLCRWIRSDVVRAAARWLVPAALALVVLPSAALAAERWLEAEDRALVHLPEWYEPAAAGGPERARIHLDIARAMAELGAIVPQGECIYAVTSAVAFYAGRTHVPVGGSLLDAAGFDAWIERRECRFFMLLAVADGTVARHGFYPRDRLGDRLAIVDVRYSEAGGRRTPIAALAVLRDRL